MKYFDYLTEHFEKHGDLKAFVADGESITYSEVDKAGAKVYRYLKEKGIGKEQIVMLLLPKKLQFYPCMLGVLRAGAAFVLVQDDYPKERIDFIREDTKCALVIDIPLFNEIMASTEPLSGYEETDPHQLCYLVYTSGSTGTPKGVLHEYGNIDECISMIPPERPHLPFLRPLLGPLSFVQSILNVIYNTMYGITTLLEPEEKLRDFEDMKNYILENKLKTIYLPPSYIRMYKEPSPYLEQIGTGSEPAGGIYYPGGKPKIMNTYSCSEAGFAVMQFELDKAYDVAPIGRPMPGVDAVLMDEEDRIIEGPGQGELCFKNEFFRGYLNHPEQSQRAKRGGYYHTNDICRRDEDGLYYVIGRNDDMIKINGNRIEPAEIEAAVQKCTGLEKVVAKGFEEEKRSYVAAYFLEDEAKKLGILDGKHLTADLSGIEAILPSYMIPTYYVPVKEFPLNASGKIARKLLEPPKAKDFMKDYEAPENKAEQALCDSMAKLLKLERVGATDDFFILGGDSMGAINLVSECKEVFLSSKIIYQYRTPREIAKHAMRRESFQELEEKNRLAMEKDWPLLPAQRQVLLNQLRCPDSGAAYIGSLVRFADFVDADRIKKAIDQVFKLHPALQTRIFKNDKGEYRQKYEPSFYKPVEIVETEEDFLTYLKNHKRQHGILDSKLYLCELVKNPKGLYLRLGINHLIVEGSTINILMKDIFRLYKEPEEKLPHDYYFALLSDMTHQREEEGFAEADAFFSGLFDEKQKAGVSPELKKDHESDVRTAGMIDMDEAFEIKPGRDGIFFMTATLLAIAWYNESDFAYITSVYNDRNDPVRMTSVGFMASALTFGLDIGKCKGPKEMLDEIRSQNTFSVVHTEYSYALEKDLDTVNMPQFNFYKGLQQWKGENDLIGETISPELGKDMPGAFVIFLRENLQTGWNGLSIRYAKELYDSGNMDKFVRLLFKAVDFLEGRS